MMTDYCAICDSNAECPFDHDRDVCEDVLNDNWRGYGEFRREWGDFNRDQAAMWEADRHGEK